MDVFVVLVDVGCVPGGWGRCARDKGDVVILTVLCVVTVVRS